MTVKLYDRDAYLKEFDASVRSCEQDGSRWRVLLDQTVFFPNEGGQNADTGTLGSAAVSGVYLEGQELYHLTDRPLVPGEQVHGRIDFSVRYDHMQNHTGEHIVSGLVHTLYGLNNVGFHLGEEELTADYDGPLTREQLDRVEEEANRAVQACLPVRTEFPPAEVLRTLQYRSKLELKENVRIVTVPGIDVCACCAPHVASTGEIGSILITDFMRWKGGVRIFVKCGMRALAEARKACRTVKEVSGLLSGAAPAEAVRALQNSLKETEYRLTGAQRALAEAMLQALPFTEGNLCLFAPSPEAARALAERASERCAGVCTVLFGSEGEYRYIMVASGGLREFARQARERLSGRGGGTDVLQQGAFCCTRAQAQQVLGG